MHPLSETLWTILIFAVPVVLAITAHEAAHGWVAHRRGDPTAWMLGRVTFNPLKHIDPVGTVLVPLLIFLSSKTLVGVPFLFGWAKPVPVNWRRLRDPRWDMALVAVAGPAANLIMALGWGLLIQLMALLVQLTTVPPWLLTTIVEACVIGIMINLFLMALNLFPLLPLDGGRILAALLPPRLAISFGQLERYGLLILLALLLLPDGQPPGLLGAVLHPLVRAVLGVIPGAGLVRDLFPV
ncbi:site-2 protease family protein [Thiohalocapsa marina]|uniref:Site-2 protease family protein n=1 Tax=Thiohalocapsa marina TaxID=424902 RepID=A0A5M8FS82_9GAMM|nr:site-2 protease family protein [Thiohalocapsa marina]KAA6184722.1 site-2 protease family protein [Thiohalocapsa marina]